jgi:hypothetical protein
VQGAAIININDYWRRIMYGGLNSASAGMTESAAKQAAEQGAYRGAGLGAGAAPGPDRQRPHLEEIARSLCEQTSQLDDAVNSIRGAIYRFMPMPLAGTPADNPNRTEPIPDGHLHQIAAQLSRHDRLMSELRILCNTLDSII